ncbi:M23 family metallopeptidase [Arthrobacter sp. zg-ZUI100]|uniref:M23 family metallopeptidase n=1 Tax=Arthrobacter jiangjiafuii TaxID=2817475 RepID=A0A975M689_9MICC|nr:M23 family metallopeptidase [Arthrobacter jiangjiafuii]MBP3037811.1 M23 family metallopeptidase [Arthrobacter jiangjiafuii]MBP3045075.1 M23 family metallopeptidase [Arthrobacter jiangjiafuii]QWC10605.1 M23 family metallopeptidase [Arthrobacter jiangjiafuii]
MSKHAAPGRRRASAPATAPRPRASQASGRRAAVPVKSRSLGGAAQKVAIGAATSGLILTAALPTTAAVSEPPEDMQPTAVEEPVVTVDPNASVDFERAALSSAFDPDAKLRQVVVAAGSEVAAGAAKGTLATPLSSDLVQTSGFGYRVSPITGTAGELHRGQDFAAACGTEVTAAASGTVTEAGWHSFGGGNRIVVDHGNGVETTYNHLSALGVAVGATVERGDLLGASGSTGASTGCHLHFEVMVNGEVVDPLGWL